MISHKLDVSVHEHNHDCDMTIALRAIPPNAMQEAFAMRNNCHFASTDVI